MFGYEWTIIWNFVLCCLVTIHLITEYFHYIHEFISQRQKKKLLDHIHSDIEEIKSHKGDCPIKHKK
jgi:hypothetical protein